MNVRARMLNSQWTKLKFQHWFFSFERLHGELYLNIERKHPQPPHTYNNHTLVQLNAIEFVFCIETCQMTFNNHDFDMVVDYYLLLLLLLVCIACIFEVIKFSFGSSRDDRCMVVEQKQRERLPGNGNREIDCNCNCLIWLMRFYWHFHSMVPWQRCQRIGTINAIWILQKKNRISS